MRPATSNSIRPARGAATGAVAGLLVALVIMALCALYWASPTGRPQNPEQERTMLASGSAIVLGGLIVGPGIGAIVGAIRARRLPNK